MYESRAIVAVIDSAVSPDAEDSVLEQQLLAAHGKVKYYRVFSNTEIVRYCREADAIILWHHPQLRADVLAELAKCKVIVRNGVGFDNVDIQAAAQLEIPVCNVPDYGTEEVADHTLALMLSLLRNLATADAGVRSGEWDWRTVRPVSRIRERSVGIVGCGRIGTATAMRARAFGCKIAFFDPYLPDGAEKGLGIGRWGTLNELLGGSDVVSLHVPLTEETRHLIGHEAFCAMRQGTLLINTSRGAVVDESALVDALGAGHLGGAGLDVLEEEPALDPRLLEFSNCILTPHCAFYSEESWTEMRTKSAHTVMNALAGQPLRNVVNGVSAATRRAAQV